MRANVCPTSASVSKQRYPGKYCRVTIVIIILRPRDKQKTMPSLPHALYYYYYYYVMNNQPDSMVRTSSFITRESCIQFFNFLKLCSLVSIIYCVRFVYRVLYF